MLRQGLVVFMLLFCVMVGSASATTITFEGLGAPGVYGGNETGVFRTNPIISSQGWTQEHGIAGNPSTAVLTSLAGPGNTQANLETYIPFLNHAAGEFTFHGMDIYRDSTVENHFFVQGLEGPETTLSVFLLDIVVPPGTGWTHFVVNNTLSQLVLGAVNFNMTHVTNTPGVTWGFDNINVCQNSVATCSFDAPLTFTAAAPGPTSPAVPESAPWIYLLLAAGVVLVLRKFFREEI